jgi:endonuclease/exonuclease/phosphatase family metal-dependent hydrolase
MTERALRVMSFNVRYGDADDGPNAWKFRRDLVARTIKAFDPDLLGVQEALNLQCDDLEAALGEDYAFHGAGRDDGKARGEFTAIFFRRPRFEPLAGGHFWLSDTPEEPGSRGWDSECNRMASWVKLRDLAAPGGGGAGTVLFINTHWDHVGKRARLESARLLRAKARELNPSGAAIMVGDFNAREHDEEYAQLLRAADDDGPRYVDAYRATHPDQATEEATFHGFRGGSEGIRIDWIIHTPDLKAVESSIDRTNEDGRYPSDHYPVTAVLTRAT